MTATLERGLNALREQIDAPVASFFTSCVSCGLCAEACLFYKETGDPQYTPIHKLEPMRRMWRTNSPCWAGQGDGRPRRARSTTTMLTEWETLVYDSCTMCGRCTLVCPVGNDITLMIRKMREGMSASGHGPAELDRRRRAPHRGHLADGQPVQGAAGAGQAGRGPDRARDRTRQTRCRLHAAAVVARDRRRTRR